jgi:hypothetical protein
MSYAGWRAASSAMDVTGRRSFLVENLGQYGDYARHVSIMGVEGTEGPLGPRASGPGHPVVRMMAEVTAATEFTTDEADSHDER